MGNNSYEISKRIEEGKTISEELYMDSLLNLTESLMVELQKRLEEEGRYSGMAKSYIHSIWESYNKINQVVEDEEFDVFEKIIYLFKPVILKEYKFLSNKRLSGGDCIIVILKKIYSIINERISTFSEYKYKRELKTLTKVIDRFFENIINKHKGAKLFNLADALKYCIEKGYIGKYNLNKIDFSEINNQGPKLVEVLDGPVDKIVEESESKVTEVTWNEKH